MPLDGVRARRDEDFLTQHITDPAEHSKRFPQLHGGTISRMPLPEPAAGFRVGAHAHGDLPEAPPPASGSAKRKSRFVSAK